MTTEPTRSADLLSSAVDAWETGDLELEVSDEPVLREYVQAWNVLHEYLADHRARMIVSDEAVGYFVDDVRDELARRA